MSAALGAGPESYVLLALVLLDFEIEYYPVRVVRPYKFTMRIKNGRRRV